jgi:signal peptidase I
MEQPTSVELPAPPRRGSKVWEWTKSLAIALILAFGIRTAVVEAFFIPSGSMEPTLQVGDRILGNKFWFWFADPHRQDIVIFAPPETAHLAAGAMIKRIIAVEGDMVEVRGGEVFVNGEAVPEPYLKERPHYYLPPTPVPPGMLFVLGLRAPQPPQGQGLRALLAAEPPGPAGVGQAAEKGPSAALRRLGTRCGALPVRLTRPSASRLAAGPF